jgi:hypothetical protein
MELTVQTLAVALAHGMGASTKASLLTRIQEALHTNETMDSEQLQLGETHQATELAAVMVWVQHQLGETHLTQSVLATASAANQIST